MFNKKKKPKKEVLKVKAGHRDIHGVLTHISLDGHVVAIPTALGKIILEKELERKTHIKAIELIFDTK